MTAGPLTPVALTLVAGAPGAGKSRLIRSLVATRPPGTTLAILTGETAGVPFRQAGADDPLSPSAQAAGCLCCAGASDVVRLLEDRLRARDNRRIAPFDRALIELGGLADPLPAFAQLAGHPYLSLRFGLTELVAVVGPDSADAMLDRLPVAVHQIELAGRIVVAGKALPGSLADRLAALTSSAALVDLEDGAASAVSGLRPLSTAHWPAPARAQYLAMCLPGAHRSAIRRAVAGEQVSVGAEDRVFTRDQPLSPAELDRFVTYIRLDAGRNILRADGQATLRDGRTRTVASVLGETVVVPLDGPGTPAQALRLALVVASGAWPDIATDMARLGGSSG